MTAKILISFVFILLVSLAISKEEVTVKFLDEIDNIWDRGIESKTILNNSNNLKKEEEMLNYMKNYSSNKFVNLLGYPVQAKVTNFHCESEKSFLNRNDGEIFNIFSNCLNAYLKTPLQLDMVVFMVNKIQKTSQSNRLISVLRLAYNAGETLNYLEMIINKHTSSELKIKLLSVSHPELKNDKLFLYKADDDQDYYYAESMAGETEQKQIDDLSVFMNYLTLLSETKEETNFIPQLFLNLDSDNYAMKYLTKSFEALKGNWSALLWQFHSSRETSIKKLLLDRGFSSYDQSIQVQILSGVRREGLQTFYNLIERRLNIPEEKRQVITPVLETIQYSDTNTWADFDIVFSIGYGAQVKYASIFANRGDNDTFNFVITEMDASFELATELTLVTKKLSILGGIFSNKTVELQENPRNITDEDLEGVFSFFTLIIYKQVAAQFGVNLELPN